MITEDIHAPISGKRESDSFTTMICPICAKYAGYKVNKDKLERHTNMRELCIDTNMN